jgi:glyoxylase-like metal-dependent hydrolase (beta-lactamase superfamily II)/rhodanese-related sulfurtransferase
VVTEPTSRQALVIDPRLDQLDEVEARLRARGATLRWVADTHTHADHLSGARRLVTRLGGELVAHARARLAAPARRVRGGDALPLGDETVTVLDAPGHTPDSLALLVGGHLFTGDALFVGGAGRTDFMGGSPADLFETFRRFEALDEGTVVHPGHDYVGRPESTIGEERRTNPLLAEHDRERLIARLDVKGKPPANMAEILRFNLAEEASSATITPAELAALRRAGGGPALLDVRGPLEFESERIDGARNLPLDELEARLGEVPGGEELVVVCRSGVRATIAAQTLERRGRRARVLEGGVVAWRRAGLPLKTGRRHLGIDRQVQLIVGSTVLASTLLGALVSPWFLLVAGFFGAGLTFAGATGTCGLALVLLRMPWNRAPAPAGGAPSTCAVGGAGGAPSSTCAVGGAR